MPLTAFSTALAGKRSSISVYVRDRRPPGYPEWRYAFFCSALEPVRATFSALTTTTKSPVSTRGAKVGLCLPRRRTAIWLASRPSTTSVASMTCHWRSTSPGFGVYVRTVVAFVSSRVVGRASAPAGLSVELVPDRQRLEPLARAHDDSPGYLPRSAGVKTPQRAWFEPQPPA